MNDRVDRIGLRLYIFVVVFPWPCGPRRRHQLPPVGTTRESAITIVKIPDQVPLNHFFVTRVTSARYDMLKMTDRRVKWTAEILQGIKMVKLYSYESRFLQYLLGIREEEMTHLRKLCYMKVRIVE